MAKILVNWYKPSGKWYAQQALGISPEFQITFCFPKDSLQLFIEKTASQLQPTWVNGDWYVAVTCIEQADADNRFFERLYKYGNVK